MLIMVCIVSMLKFPFSPPGHPLVPLNLTVHCLNSSGGLKSPMFKYSKSIRVAPCLRMGVLLFLCELIVIHVRFVYAFEISDVFCAHRSLTNYKIVKWSIHQTGVCCFIICEAEKWRKRNNEMINWDGNQIYVLNWKQAIENLDAKWNTCWWFHHQLFRYWSGCCCQKFVHLAQPCLKKILSNEKIICNRVSKRYENKANDR